MKKARMYNKTISALKMAPTSCGKSDIVQPSHIQHGVACLEKLVVSFINCAIVRFVASPRCMCAATYKQHKPHSSQASAANEV